MLFNRTFAASFVLTIRIRTMVNESRHASVLEPALGVCTIVLQKLEQKCKYIAGERTHPHVQYGAPR
jgi:hypothetical protein